MPPHCLTLCAEAHIRKSAKRTPYKVRVGSLLHVRGMRVAYCEVVRGSVEFTYSSKGL